MEDPVRRLGAFDAKRLRALEEENARLKRLPGNTMRDNAGLITGRRSRVLNIVDDVTRECIRAVVDTRISGRRVVRQPDDLIAERGRPKMIVSDDGTELTLDADAMVPSNFAACVTLIALMKHRCGMRIERDRSARVASRG